MPKHESAGTTQFYKNLCTKIVNIRIKQKRTRIDVAVGADLNPNYYGRIERGVTGNMHMGTLLQIRRSLGVKWEELFDPDGPILAVLHGTENDNEDKN